MSRLVIRKTADGKFLPRHHAGVDPSLVGLKALEHPAVREWWEWLRSSYKPKPLAVVTPCSNVKPYTRSPVARKVAAVLRRSGAWGVVEWLFLSDLLLLVPHSRVEEYPACCYELHPRDLLSSPRHYESVVEALASTVEALTRRGWSVAVTFLPRSHARLWSDARERASAWPREVSVKYNIFTAGELEETLRRLLTTGTRGAGGRGEEGG